MLDFATRWKSQVTEQYWNYGADPLDELHEKQSELVYTNVTFHVVSPKLHVMHRTKHCAAQRPEIERERQVVCQVA